MSAILTRLSSRLYQKSGVPDETLSSDIKVFNISRDNVFGSSCEQVMGQDATLLQVHYLAIRKLLREYI